LSQRIQSAIDEVGKHDRYAALQAQEAKCMSEPFLKAEISKATEKIANLQSTIDYYLKQQATAKQTISDYEKKPSIAKLLSNKNIVNLAQATLTSIQRELPGAEDDLHLQENRKLKYCKQLEELLLLQEEMRRVFPSRTQEFWSDEVDKLQTEFSATRKALADFTAHEETIYAEICNLEHRQEEAKPSFERLSELGRQQRQEQNRLAAMKKLYDRENAVCSELLEQEFTFCSAFFQKPTSNYLVLQIQILLQADIVVNYSFTAFIH
jgi:chromosome segregation ATPase